MSAPEPIPSPEPDPMESPQPGERPAWLVGAEEGATSEQERLEPPAAEVKLNRPAPVPVEGFERGGDALQSTAAAPGLRLAARPTPDSPASAKPQAWTAKGSSVPRLVVVPAGVRPDSAGETPEDFGAEPERDAAPIADLGAALIGVEDAAQARTPVRPLDEPWWMVMAERLATDRRLQLTIVIALAVLVAAVTFWPREGRGVSVARIQQHPEAFENQTVRVHGRVEEVFPLGQGWVYDLSQGRQSITVFTRGAMPQRHQDVVVVGQVSTGYLDGKPRVAILEGDRP